MYIFALMSVKTLTICFAFCLLCLGVSYAQVNQNDWPAETIAYDENGDVVENDPLKLPDVLSLCGGEEGEIEISGKFKEIQWSNGAKTSSIVVQDTGMYYVSVFNGTEWFKDSIHVIRIPELRAKATKTVVLCEGKIVKITGNTEAKSWEWSTGTKKWGISVTLPGTYYVSSSNDCYTVTDTFQVVKSAGYPTTLSTAVPTCLKNNIPLNAFGPADNYKWSTGQTSQQIIVNNEGGYSVTFKVCDSVFTQNFTVDIKARSANPLYFPNVFTPNGDNTNDNFRMVGATDQITEFQISIFNRWGVLLYKSNEPTFEWNGVYKGSVVPDGVYFYGGGYKHNCTGDQFIPVEGSITVQK